MNPTTGLFQTLVAAAATASKNLVFSNAMLDCVYLDYQPITPDPYTALTVNIPTVSEGDVVDIGAGPLQPTDTAHSTVTINFDKHDSTSWVIKSWDKIRTPADLARLYIQPRTEALLRKVNRRLVSQVNATNFNAYAAIAGAGADTFQRADLAAAWRNLAAAGVPVEDAGNMFLVSSPLAYSNMLADTNFFQESIVGVEAAVKATQRATIAPQFNTRIRWDPQFAPVNAGKEPGLFFHRYAIAMVTADMPASGSPDVHELTFFPRPNVPVQLQVQYSLKDQGWLFNLHTGYGIKVVRPDHASFMETA